jgi:hypothetical protein
VGRITDLPQAPLHAQRESCFGQEESLDAGFARKSQGDRGNLAAQTLSQDPQSHPVQWLHDTSRATKVLMEIQELRENNIEQQVSADPVFASVRWSSDARNGGTSCQSSYDRQLTEVDRPASAWQLMRALKKHAIWASKLSVRPYQSSVLSVA